MGLTAKLGDIAPELDKIIPATKETPKLETATEVGTFNAEVKDIKIRGGKYSWVDTQDGYYVVKRVPLMSVVPKGTKNAPYDVTKEILQEFCDNAQNRYQSGNFCATAFVGHNPDIALTHPDFLGYVLPNEVAPLEIDGKERQTLFGDIKIDKSHFDLARAGKLPYHSPEVPWERRRISGLAFLDTLPPYFEYSLFTIGDQTFDEAAKFSAKPDEEEMNTKLEKEILDLKAKLAKFESDGDEDEGFSKQYPKTSGTLKRVSDGINAIGKKLGIMDFSAKKPNALPVEPEGKGNMDLNPEMAAKFYAQEQAIDEMKSKFAAQEKSELVRTLTDEASKMLIGKIVRSDLPGKFAVDAVEQKNPREWLSKTIEILKPSLKSKPTSDGNFEASDVSKNPETAKLVEAGISPDKISKYESQYRQQKALFKGHFDGVTLEQFVKNRIDHEKWETMQNMGLVTSEE